MARIHPVRLLSALIGCLACFNGNAAPGANDSGNTSNRVAAGSLQVMAGAGSAAIERGAGVPETTRAEGPRHAVGRILAAKTRLPPVRMRSFGLDANLQISWQGGEMHFTITFAPKPAPNADVNPAESGAVIEKVNYSATWQRFALHDFWVSFGDKHSEVAKAPLASQNIRDASGKVIGKQAKSSVALPVETYKRINTWTLMWGPQTILTMHAPLGTAAWSEGLSDAAAGGDLVPSAMARLFAGRETARHF